jgi:hypothetical protein
VRGPRDVAIPSYGLVAFAAIYCRPEAIETIAENLRGIEGADVIVSRLANGSVDGGANLEARIRAAASPATADLAWSPDGRKYRYTAHDGDPLGLVPVFDSLRAQGSWMRMALPATPICSLPPPWQHSRIQRPASALGR